MTYALAKWYDPFAVDWHVDIKSDEDTWVDFNAEVWDEPTGYGSGLLELPTVEIKAEGAARQIFEDAISPLEFVNTPAQGGSRGLWSLPISPDNPVRLGTRTFSGWKNRLVRIRVTIHTAAGTVETSLGDFLIDDVRPKGNQTTIYLVSLIDLLRTTSAETIREGGLPYRGKSLRFLLNQLILRAYPDVFVNLPDKFDLPEFATPRASSWGQSPGDLSGVVAGFSAYRWVARCMVPNHNDPDELIIGYEVSGNEFLPGGGLAFFNVVTGKYRIVQTPLPYFEQWFPISIEPHTGTGFSVFFVQEQFVSNTKDPFWSMKEARFASDGSLVSGGLSAKFDYWPARETWRKGHRLTQVSDFFMIGYSHSATEIPGTDFFYNEPVIIPFPQRVESIIDIVHPSTPTQAWKLKAGWHSYKPGDQGEDSTIRDYEVSHDVFEPGQYTARISRGIGTVDPYAFLRYHLATAFSAKPIVWGSEVFFIGDKTNSHGYEFVKRSFPDMDTSGSSVYLGFSVSSPQWDKQITAYVAAPGRTGTFAGWMATIAFADDAHVGDTQIPWSASELWFIDRFGNLTATPVWSESPVGNNADTARCIVDLVTFRRAATETADGFIAVMLDRVDVSRPCYGLMIGTSGGGTTATILQLFGEQGYEGPVSGRPFEGFTVITMTASAVVVRFYDPANGQAHEVTIPDTGAPTFAVVNSAEPIHTQEHSLSTDRGVHFTATDGVERSFIGCAPGPIGGVLAGAWHKNENNPSSVRHLPGFYPLVQISTSRTGVIEVANFEDMSSLDGTENILELAPGYSLQPPESDQVWITKDEAGVPVIYLRNLDEVGVVDPLKLNEWPVLNGPDLVPRVLYSELRTAVEIIPHEFVSAGPAEGTLLKTAGSTFGGTFIWDVSTERAGSVVLEAVHGSSPVTDDPTGLRQGAALFRWRSLLETVTVYATAAVAAGGVSLFVGGLRLEGGRYYAGEIDISAGGKLKVKSGPIVDFTPTTVSADGSAVRLDLGAAIGVNVAAFSEVEINPVDAEAVSDGPEGVTKLMTPLGTSSTDDEIEVASTLEVYSGMILRIASEYMTVQAIKRQATAFQTGQVTVIRGARSSKLTGHASGDPIQAFVSVQRPSTLYPVGQTGVLFGISFDRELELASRTLSAGDGVRITSTGYVLRPMRHAIKRRVSAEAEARYLRGELSRKTNRGRPNPFIDIASASPLADARLAEGASPPYEIEGVEIPFLATLRTGDTVAYQSNILPTNEEKLFRIIDLEHNGPAHLSILTIRAHESWDEVIPLAKDQPNPGFAAEPAAVTSETKGAPRGQRGGYRRTP